MRRRASFGARPLSVAIAAAAMLAAAASAQLCTVPGTHPTIQAAVDDVACPQIEIAAQSHAESVLVRRALTLSGPAAGGAIIEGRLRVGGAGVVVGLNDLRVENGCAPAALSAVAGAAIDADGVEVVRDMGLPCPVLPIFADGFESGDTSAWDVAIGASP